MFEDVLIVNDAKVSARSKDENGYLIIKNNPIAKAGVFQYLESEVLPYGGDPNKFVKVYRPFEDLEAKKDFFAKKPIVFRHNWVGVETDSVDGAIGDEIRAEYPYLYADLIIYSQELIKEIEDNNIVELSPGYRSVRLPIGGNFEGESYEYVQYMKGVNHLAVVKEGRGGKDLRVLDEKPIRGDDMDILEMLTKAIVKVKDEAPKVTKTEDEDKRDLIRRVMAIAGKPNDEFAGGEEEKVEAIAKLLEEIAYKPSEAGSVVDEEPKEEVVVKEVKEEKKVEDDTPDTFGEEFFKKLDAFIDSKLQAFADSQMRVQDAKARAYSEVSAIAGHFNTEGMSEADIYAKGYQYMTGNKPMAGVDARSAFITKVQDMKPSFVEDSKPDVGLSEEQKALLSRLG